MIVVARSCRLGVSALAMATFVEPSPAVPILPGGTSSLLPDTLGFVTLAVSRPDGLFSLGWPIRLTDGSGNSVMVLGSTSPTGRAIRQAEPFVAVAYRSGSVFLASPSGGPFNFAMAAPRQAPKLTRFLVGAEPVETVTDQELQSIVTSTDGFNEMPFYVIWERGGRAQK